MCQRCQELMMDVLYGEEVQARDCFDFFQHLNGCDRCRREYLELLQTRALMGRWKVEEKAPTPSIRLPTQPWSHRLRHLWLPLLPKIAAGVLVLMGAFSALQVTGVWQPARVMVSQPQLMEMVNDLVVARQTEERHWWGQALVNFADEMDSRQRQDMWFLTERLVTLEQHYIDNQEENNQRLQVLLSR